MRAQVKRPREQLRLLEEQVELINRFPDQNPNPVLRTTIDGLLLYANPASAPILECLGVRVGDRLPDDVQKRLGDAAATAKPDVVELVSGVRTFAVLAVPVPEFGFINLYGTDITASKVLARFPDRNPNPVLRVSEEGMLLYANDASRLVTWTFGCTIGEPLPDDIRGKILAALDGSGDPSFEVQTEGRTFSMLPVRIPEFGFINVYGTDVTAVKAMNRFPDQNPNPVLRVTRQGVLAYANPASTAIVRTLGMTVGGAVEPQLWLEIDRRIETSSSQTIEVEAEGRLYSILVVAVYEFSAVNLYGTDITAAREVERANRENRQLLVNILPEPIADRLQRGERVIADRFEDVTLLFADIVGFTAMSSRMSANEVVDVLNQVFSLFDALVDKYRLEKIKTIGDAYMVVGGLTVDEQDHVVRVADMALELVDAAARIVDTSGSAIRVRVGIHRGPVVAGVIGAKKFIYDVWGDTVNTASRMESHSVPGCIQVTYAVLERLKDQFTFESRGLVEVKGKGPMPTWFLIRRADHVETVAEPAMGDRAGIP